VRISVNIAEVTVLWQLTVFGQKIVVNMFLLIQWLIELNLEKMDHVHLHLFN